MRERRKPVVEILYFDGCPNYRAVLERVEYLAAELGLEPELRLIKVEDVASAERTRFLGSPTIRVDGRDIEPGADKRDGYQLACRVYRTPQRGRAEWPGTRVAGASGPRLGRAERPRVRRQGGRLRARRPVAMRGASQESVGARRPFGDRTIR
jgi:hypothetical protein